MKKWIVVLVLSLLIVGGVVLAKVPWDQLSEPKIPHSITERVDCTNCHGLSGVKPYPSWHAERKFAKTDCLKCHQLAVSAGSK